MLKLPAVLQPTSTARIAGVCKSISLALAASLVFLVPFDAARNIDMQGLILIISGGFAWIALLLGNRGLLTSIDKLPWILLTVFGIAGIISLLVSPNLNYSFIGSPYIRLGVGAWLSCFSIGLLCTSVPKRRLLASLYLLIAGLAVVSLPYTWLHIHSLLRAGGVFSQADILACFLGCGLLFGLEMLNAYPKYRHYIVGFQFLMGIMLLITQTRAVILLVAALGLLWIFQHSSRQTFKLSLGVTAAALILLTGWNHLASTRLANTDYASQSLHYRLTLQDYALRATAEKPLLGYGPGNLADALNCSRLLDKALLTTCDEGYFFNSSHNIFIDRILAIGWPGALAFLAVTILAAYRNLREKGTQRIWGYTLVLVSGYYMTNVTSVTLELLFWILLFQCLSGARKPRTEHA